VRVVRALEATGGYEAVTPTALMQAVAADVKPTPPDTQ
jgi:hypothetical protein